MTGAVARLRRILLVVPWLIDHPGVAVEEAAARFDLTSEELLDDLDVLGFCGLPGYGGGDLIEVDLSGGGIVLRLADFFSRPLALTVREGVALVLAARAALDAGLLGTERADDPLRTALATLEEHLGSEVDLPVSLDVRTEGGELLDVLRPAVQGRRVVRLTYRSASRAETTVRDVEPWALQADAGAWYLQGWCRAVDAQRVFRLDRISQVEVLDERATHPVPEDPGTPRYEPVDGDEVVVIEVAPYASWIADQVVTDAREVLDDGWTRLTFRTASHRWAAGLVLRLGPLVRAVSPPSVAVLAAEDARGALAQYPEAVD